MKEYDVLLSNPRSAPRGVRDQSDSPMAFLRVVRRGAAEVEVEVEMTAEGNSSTTSYHIIVT